MSRSLILVIAVFFCCCFRTSPLEAQPTTPFAECGEIVLAPGFCFWFRANGVDYDIGPAQATVAPGDIVFITGDHQPNCQNLCFVNDCILNAVVTTPCPPPFVPFQACGMLVAGTGGCSLFQSDTGETYEIADTGMFSVGDTVFVDGDLDQNCSSSCGATSGCLVMNTIDFCPQDDFVRGDCGADGLVNIADAVFMLGVIFPAPGGPDVPDCVAACDANDDGALNIADAVALLAALFQPPAGALPDPVACGQDPTQDMLGCDDFSVCP